VLFAQDDIEQSAVLAESALAIARQINDPEQTALAIHLLGVAERGRGRWGRAAALMEDARVRWCALGTPTNEAMALVNLSTIAYHQGDVATSAQRAEEALVLFRATGHASGVARALRELARLAVDRGDDGRALSAYQESLHLLASINERWFIVHVFLGLGLLAAIHDRPDQMATLIGAVDACLDERGFTIFADDRSTYEQAITTTRNALGEQRFADLRAFGRTLAMREAVDLAAAVTIPPRTTRPCATEDSMRPDHRPSGGA
jgi:tetratricopeptide (TPR) repeat protein